MSERMYYSNEAKKRARTQRTLLALIFTALGLSIGAAIALLFAPMEGDEMRNELADKAGKARHNIEEYSDQAKKAVMN